MKALLSKNDLVTAVIRSQGAVSEKVLAHVGLKTENNQLRMAVSDRVLSIYSRVLCEIPMEGECFVPARIFTDVFKELPEGLVTLEKIDPFLWVTAGKNNEFKMKIPLVENKAWIEPPVLQTANSGLLSSQKFSYLVEQIQFCISTESPRPFALVALLHKPEKNKIRLVGSDGYRLSYAEMDGEFPSSFLTTGITLSKRALVELLKMCNEGFEHVNFSISEDMTTFMASVPNYEIFIRPSSVQYPNYQGVLPKGSLSMVGIPKTYIQSVAKRVLLAADKSRALHLSFADDTLTVKARTVGSSEGTEKIALESYNGPLREFSLNGKYLYDVFSAITSNTIQLHFKSGEEPFVVVPDEEPEFCQSMHILVPIKESRET